MVDQELENQYRVAKRGFSNYLFLKGSPESASIRTFPEEWSAFWKGELDQVQSSQIEGKGNAVACIYKSHEGGIFPAHIHDTKEMIVLVKGRMMINTAEETVILDKPSDYHTIEESKAHSLTISPGTVFMMVWHDVESVRFDWPSTDDRPVGCKERRLRRVAKKLENLMIFQEAADGDKRNYYTSRIGEIRNEIRVIEKNPCRIENCEISCLLK
jgi:hypothetical protein